MTGDQDQYAEILARYAQEFLEEAAEALAGMWALLGAATVEPFQADDNFAALRRSLHTLKGQGSSFGFPSITMVAHQFEDFLEGLAGTDASGRDGIERYLSVLEKIVEDGVEPSQWDIQEFLRSLPSSPTAADAEITIVLVSAAKVIRHKIRREIEAFGFRVITIADAFDALRYVARAQPSCVIWSATLDGVSGFDMIRATEVMAATRDIPTVLLTSFDMTNTQIRALPRYIPVVQLKQDTSDDIAAALSSLELKAIDPKRSIRKTTR